MLQFIFTFLELYKYKQKKSYLDNYSVISYYFENVDHVLKDINIDVHRLELIWVWSGAKWEGVPLAHPRVAH